MFSKHTYKQFLLTIPFLITACAPTANQLGAQARVGIVNGIDGVAADIAKGGLAESVVFLQVKFDDSNISFCSGTLISNRLILTAAHCVYNGGNAESIEVQIHALNAIRPGADSVQMTATNYRIHPGFIEDAATGKVNDSNDLAMILLPAPIPEEIRTAILPTATSQVSSPLLAVGYGISNPQHKLALAQTGIGVLRYTYLTPGGKFANPTTEQKDLISVPVQKSTTCEGDSGGPLLLTEKNKSTNQIIGVAQSFIPSFSGVQLSDYRAAQNSDNPDSALEDFYKKYPTATDCSAGYDNFVDLRLQLPWIRTAIIELLPDLPNASERPSELDPTPFIPGASSEPNPQL